MAFWETVLGKYIMTMAIAAVPVVELRGAIPAGIAAGLDPWLACGAAIFGNLLPVPFIILLVRQVFDRLRKHAFFAPKIDALERRAHLKGRLKGGNHLSAMEANELIDQLLKLDNPYACPHGRPTIISMSRYELEKKFKRIV